MTTPCSDIIQETCRKVKVIGMKLLKRMLCILLCVVILSGSVGTKYFDANHMERVDAVAETVAVGIGLSVMFAICFYVGSVMYAYAPVKPADLTDEQVVRAGHSAISYMVGHNLLNSTAPPSIPMIAFMDSAGQRVVLSQEAARRIAATSVLLIMQAGSSPGNGDDDDEDEDKKEDIRVVDGLIEMAKGGKDLFATCGLGFATVLGTLVRNQFDKFQNNEESLYDEMYQYITDADIAAQWSGETYSYSSHVRFDWSFQNTGESDYHYCTETYNLSNDSTSPVCCYIRYDYAPEELSFWFMSLDRYGNPKNFTVDSTRVTTQTYKGKTDTSTYSTTCYYVSNLTYPDISFSANCPVFSSRADAENYLKGLSDATSALNYAKTYRIADWLQNDWRGKLLDPLTGLQALSDLFNIALHNGLNALGNNPDVDAFEDYLRDYFENVGKNPKPDPDPVTKPVLDPSGGLAPETDLDPGKNPVIRPDPDIEPDPSPGTKPDPKPDPDPGTDPDPKPDPDPAPLPDMDAADYKVELTGVFPFCIPFDFIALLKTLDAAPRAPCFDFPVVIPALDYREDVKLDLSIFDDVAKVIRLCEKVSFILFLMFVTSKVIRW